MFFSAQQNLLFIHIPKTAGSSIKLALKPYDVVNPSAYTQDDRLLAFLRDRPPHLIAKGMQFPNHIGVREIQQRLVFDITALTSFAVVRHPGDRLWSLYQHYRRDPHHPYHDVASKSEFPEFLQFLIEQYRTAPYTDALPQMDYLVNQAGQIGVNYLLRFEALTEGLKTLCQKLNLTLQMPQINVAPETESRDRQFTTETQQLIQVYEPGMVQLGMYDLTTFNSSNPVNPSTEKPAIQQAAIVAIAPPPTPSS